jgi:hypothetical protein
MNKKLATVNIKGKEYVEVKTRIQHFRETYPNGLITTEVIKINEDIGFILIKAEVYIDGNLVATGHAYERESVSFINKTSFVENCETSAVGRALGILGIGIDGGGIASADEMETALEKQNSIKGKTEPAINSIPQKNMDD